MHYLFLNLRKIQQNIHGIGNLVKRGSGVWALNTEYRHTLLRKNVLYFKTTASGIQGVYDNLVTIIIRFLKTNPQNYVQVQVCDLYTSIFSKPSFVMIMVSLSTTTFPADRFLVLASTFKFKANILYSQSLILQNPLRHLKFHCYMVYLQLLQRFVQKMNEVHRIHSMFLLQNFYVL